MPRLGKYAEESNAVRVVKSFIKNGANQAKAAKELGIRQQSLNKALRRPAAQKILAKLNEEALRRAGATLEKIYKRISEAMDANLAASYKGEIIESSVPDARIRLDAAIEALELTGRKKTAANQDDITKPTEIHIHYGHRSTGPRISAVRPE